MPDLGHELMFGVSLPNPASQAATVVRLAQLSEQRGLDLIGVQDHPYNPDLLDTWTLLAHLAAATELITLLPDVACVPLRTPAVLARAAASLDLLSDGRVELGVGAGYFLDSIAGFGGPTLTRGESVEALEEAIAVIRAIWTADEPITLPGKFHHLEQAAPGPAPAHPIGIWVGAYEPRMLSLTSRLADGWIPSQAYANPDDTARLNKRLDVLAIDAGRQPADILRLYNVSGRFAATGRGFLDGPSDALGRAAHRTRSRAGILVVHPGSVRRHHRLHQPVRRRGRARCPGTGVGGTLGNAGPREKIPCHG